MKSKQLTNIYLINLLPILFFILSTTCELNLKRSLTISNKNSIYLLKREIFQAELGTYQWNDDSIININVVCKGSNCKSLHYVFFQNFYIEINKYKDYCRPFPIDKESIDFQIKYHKIQDDRFQESTLIIDYNNICQDEPNRVTGNDSVEIDLVISVDLKKIDKKNYFYVGKIYKLLF